MSRERFLTWPMAVGFGLYALFALSLSYFQVKGDGALYFNLLRKFFGEEPDFAYAYQYGNAIWNAPFFLVGKTLGVAFGFQPPTFHVSFEEIAITIAANAALVLTLYLGWRILRELELPRGPGVLFLTVLGTPLFFAAVFDPAGKHVVDTLVLTGATYAFMRIDSGTAATAAVVLGALCGWSLNIRWANVAFFAVLAVVLWLRGHRELVGIAAGTAVAVAVVILALPALRGIDYYFPIIKPPGEETATPTLRLAAPADRLAVEPLEPSDPRGFFDPTIPAKMLFSDHRGLFLWTPLTAAAAIGFGLAVARARRTRNEHAPFLLALLAASLALLCIHSFWPRWDGGFAFSQRFLTGLFPLFLIGVAELVRRAGAWAYPALVLGAAFAVWVALVRDIGYDNIGERDAISRVVEAGWHDRSQVRDEVRDDVKARWRYLGGLLQGRDTACIYPDRTRC
jgi:hypothetical protein